MTFKAKMTVEELLGREEAMAYLGMKKPTWIYHTSVRHHIKPDRVIGRQGLYFRSTLDAFKNKHMVEDGLTVNEAAEYLGVEADYLRYHLYKTKRLVADGKKDNRLIFRVDTLDAIRQWIEAGKDYPEEEE
jgi:hypothetical protein